MTYEEFCLQYHIKGLNPQQETAVKRVNGATLLLAVPGSGKTTVIVARTGYMLHVCGIKPENILTLTYTKAAATEMKERFIKKFGGENGTCPHFSTINSFCVSVIGTCAREKGIFVPTLVPNNEGIIRQLAIPLMPEYPSDSSVKQLAQQIGKAKNEMMSWDALAQVENPDVDFQDFFRRYNLFLQDNNLMDFDDQLIMAYNLLQQFPDILSRAHRRYQYVSLDEAQDTSLIQHKIVEMLVGKDGNIFMVGDEDQSIYAFRGAYPTALLNFRSTYNNAEVLFMETNYRSDKKIVNTSNGFIKRNTQRNDKNMAPQSKEEGVIDILYQEDMKNTPEFLMKLIQKHLATPGDSTLAILYRNNDSIVPTTDLLNKNGIVVRQRDSISQFVNNFLVKDVITWLQFAKNPRDMGLFSQLYYKAGLYIKKSDLDDIAMEVAQHPKKTIFQCIASMGRYKRLWTTLRSKELSLKRIITEKPSNAVHDVAYDLGYWDDWLERKISAGASEDSFRLKLNMLKIVASHYDTIDEFLSALNGLAQNVPSDPNSRVTLSTIHSSKGLEFDEVYIIDAIDGILPASSPNMTLEQEEEEARLFYVGATRAKHKLTFLVPRKCIGMKLDKSDFLTPYEIAAGKITEGNRNTREAVYQTETRAQRKADSRRAGKTPSITDSTVSKLFESKDDQKARESFHKEQLSSTLKNPVDLSWLHEGLRVKHPTFGHGVITSVDEKVIVVLFEKVGEKRLSKDFCAREDYLSVVS